MSCESSGSARAPQVTLTAPKERPILFSGPMVRAILEGCKTQTRRAVKSQPPEWTAPVHVGWYSPVVINKQGIEQPGEDIFGAYDEEGVWGRKSPYGALGDRLWVRETFYCDDFEYPDGPVEEMRELLFYRADDPDLMFEEGGRPPWRPSIHMPRWASRILLEVADVRVERVQDISPQDALAEGVEMWVPGRTEGPYRIPGKPEVWFMDPVEAFANLWHEVNGKRPGCRWVDNPWVWVVEFKRLQKEAEVQG